MRRTAQSQLFRTNLNPMFDILKSKPAPAPQTDPEKETLKQEVAALSSRLAALEEKFSAKPPPPAPPPRIIMLAAKGGDEPRPVRLLSPRDERGWEFCSRLDASAGYSILTLDRAIFPMKRDGYTVTFTRLTEEEAEEVQRRRSVVIEAQRVKDEARANRKFILVGHARGEAEKPIHIKGTPPHPVEWEFVDRLHADIFSSVASGWRIGELLRSRGLEITVVPLTPEEVAGHVPIIEPVRGLPGNNVFDTRTNPGGLFDSFNLNPAPRKAVAASHASPATDPYAAWASD
jgi:hypothetical protein